MVQRAASRIRSQDVSRGISFESASVSKLVASYVDINNSRALLKLVSTFGTVQSDIDMRRLSKGAVGTGALAKLSRPGRGEFGGQVSP